jgi:predicted XRE-type DNA-binding protein
MEEGAIDMARKDSKTQTFDDVFDALADTPAEAANMRARSDLLAAIVKQVETWNVSQEEAAARLKITRPRLNDLMRGKLGKFSLDALVNLATASGLVLKIQVKTKIEKAA